MVKLGQKIKKARLEKRITQEDLASAIGVSDKSISAYESNRINPPISVLERIADETDLTLGYFLDNSKDQEVEILSKLKSVEKLFLEIKELLKVKS